MTENFVTIQTFRSLAEANLLASFLESQGVETNIPNENAIGAAMGEVPVEVPVQVYGGKVSEANELLKEREEQNAEIPEEPEEKYE